MSDMTHTEAEEALASGDEEDVAEALEAEREEAEAPAEEAALSTTPAEDVPSDDAATTRRRSRPSSKGRSSKPWPMKSRRRSPSRSW